MAAILFRPQCVSLFVEQRLWLQQWLKIFVLFGCKPATTFLAATKLLYEWFSPSVCSSFSQSLCNTFFTIFQSSCHHEIFRSYCHWEKWCRSQTLRCCHNEHNGISNNQSHDCLLNRYSGADQRKHQSSTSLAFVRGIYLWPVNSLHKGPVTRKMMPFDEVIMRSRLEVKDQGHRG